MSDDKSQSGSVTHNLNQLSQKPDDSTAQQELFRRYYHMVLEKAQRRLHHTAVVDASDVAVSVWVDIFRGLNEGKFQCHDREEFEELLGKITFRKATSLFNWVKTSRRHPAEKRETDMILGSFSLNEEHRRIAELYYLEGRSPAEIAAAESLDLDQVQERLQYIRRYLQKHRYKPTQPAKTEGIDQLAGGESPLSLLLFDELIQSFDDTLRETIVLKLQGFDNRQIAEQLDVTERQIQRRLKLVRDLLTAELTEDDES
jgi:DNA-directed RNA polymerase specialized sigma24 family protein